RSWSPARSGPPPRSRRRRPRHRDGRGGPGRHRPVLDRRAACWPRARMGSRYRRLTVQLFPRGALASLDCPGGLHLCVAQDLAGKRLDRALQLLARALEALTELALEALARPGDLLA